MTPEGKLVAYIRRRVRELGGLCRKCSWEGHAGAPDLLILLRGRRFRFVDHRGNVFHSRDEILEFWHISRGRFYAKKALGLTDEEILREQESRLEDKDVD